MTDLVQITDHELERIRKDAPKDDGISKLHFTSNVVKDLMPFHIEPNKLPCDGWAEIISKKGFKGLWMEYTACKQIRRNGFRYDRVWKFYRFSDFDTSEGFKIFCE